jgi:hypothetical protein
MEDAPISIRIGGQWVKDQLDDPAFAQVAVHADLHRPDGVCGESVVLRDGRNGAGVVRDERRRASRHADRARIVDLEDELRGGRECDQHGAKRDRRLTGNTGSGHAGDGEIDDRLRSSVARLTMRRREADPNRDLLSVGAQQLGRWR